MKRKRKKKQNKTKGLITPFPTHLSELLHYPPYIIKEPNSSLKEDRWVRNNLLAYLHSQVHVRYNNNLFKIKLEVLES
jgi:hypothetical protein